MSALAVLGPSFVREHLRTRLTLVLLVAVPAFFVLIFASVLGQFATALGGSLAGQAATAISAGWAAAFLSGALAFFEVVSSRGADRRLALAGLGAGRVALARITAAVSLAVVVSAVAFLTLTLRSGIAAPSPRSGRDSWLRGYLYRHWRADRSVCLRSPRRLAAGDARL